VAPSEALGVLYRVMHPVLYCRILMAIEIASNLSKFLVVIDLLLPITIAKKHSNS
jgi:hypothetical protein